MAVAVIDRTADIEAAARELARTRLIFGGKSTQAVDLVLVSEFVVDDLAAKLAEELARPFENETGLVRTKAGHQSSRAGVEKRPGSLLVGSSGHVGGGEKLYEVNGVSLIKIGPDRQV